MISNNAKNSKSIKHFAYINNAFLCLDFSSVGVRKTQTMDFDCCLMRASWIIWINLLLAFSGRLAEAKIGKYHRVLYSMHIDTHIHAQAHTHVL